MKVCKISDLKTYNVYIQIFLGRIIMCKKYIYYIIGNFLFHLWVMWVSFWNLSFESVTNLKSWPANEMCLSKYMEIHMDSQVIHSFGFNFGFLCEKNPRIRRNLKISVCINREPGNLKNRRNVGWLLPKKLNSQH